MAVNKYKQLNHYWDRRTEKLSVKELLEFAELLREYRLDILRELKLAQNEALGIK